MAVRGGAEESQTTNLIKGEIASGGKQTVDDIFLLRIKHSERRIFLGEWLKDLAPRHVACISMLTTRHRKIVGARVWW
jgi:hypothetical protein